MTERHPNRPLDLWPWSEHWTCLWSISAKKTKYSIDRLQRVFEYLDSLVFEWSRCGGTFVCHSPATLRTRVRFRREMTTQIDCAHDLLLNFKIFKFYGSVGWQTMRRRYPRWTNFQMASKHPTINNVIWMGIWLSKT